MELKKQKTNYINWLYTVLLIASVSTAGYLINFDQVNRQTHTDVMQQLSTMRPVEVSVDGSNKTIHIADQAIFTDHGTWTYIGPNKSYAADYIPTELVNVPVAHSKDEAMMLATAAAQPLQKLFAAADSDGYKLIIASAYRSIENQTKLQKDFIDRLGDEMADNYINKPGSSEHHTGLAVDIDDFSPGCELDSDACYISLQTANWLADNAYKYGFILRYPEGKQPITDMAYEAWHYRYVGTPLATMLTEAELTFDEFIAQVAPGRLK